MANEFDQKEIRGLNLRQILALIAACVTMLALYFDIRNEIHENRQETILTRELIKTVEASAKEEREFRRIEMQTIRAELKQISENQRAFDLRLTVMETIISNK
jgi:hypothetical protein